MAVVSRWEGWEGWEIFHRATRERGEVVEEEAEVEVEGLGMCTVTSRPGCSGENSTWGQWNGMCTGALVPWCTVVH